MSQDIFSYIKSEENRFETERISVGDNWDWSFRDHVQLIFHLKNSQFFTGTNGGFLRAFKQIMEPVLELAYWSEDIEVKDIIFFIEGQADRVKSFLIKKYHDEVFVRENDLDTFLDEITENDVDYGGVFVQKTNKIKPEVLPLQSIAFCDQTDAMGGPIGLKFNFSPAKLRSMSAYGWGNKKSGANITIEDLITLANEEKESATLSGVDNTSTGKNIEVYVVRGTLPDAYLDNGDDYDYWCPQVHICAFYTDPKGKKTGVHLYRKKDTEESVLFHTSKAVFGRALGRGTGEMLLHDQVWTNFLTIHKMNMIEMASKVPLYTDDVGLSNRQTIQDMENLEIISVDAGKRIFQVPTAAPANIQLFENAVNEFFEHAQLQGAAFDPLLGKEPPSGTTFRGQERSVAQGRGSHDRRRGQRAKFVERIYREWIIPAMVKEIAGGKEFLASLSADELQWVSDQLAENFADMQRKEDVLSGLPPRDRDLLIQEAKQSFSKKGNKHLLEILKGELEGIEDKIGINIAGKQKDLVGLSDKVLSVFQFALTNPIPPHLTKPFNDILEYGGISPVDFSSVANFSVQQPQMQTAGQPTDPLQLAQATASV